MLLKKGATSAQSDASEGTVVPEHGEGEIFGLLWGSLDLPNRGMGCAGNSHTVSLSNSQRRMQALETCRLTSSWPAYSRSGSFR